jgi:large subunit ribosomal protein L29
MNNSELEKKLLQLRAELFNLRSKASGPKVEKPHKFSQIRHDIARILTILRERKNVKK